VRQPAAALWGSLSVNRLAIGLTLAVLAIYYVVLRNGGWVYDDNLLLVYARKAGLTWHWLDQPIFQHWDVGMNAVYSVMLHLFPFDYRWGLLLMLSLLGASMLVFERVIGMVVGRGWVSLALAGWLGVSILWTRQLQWWAAGVQELPTLLCDLVCLYAFLRYEADPRNRWIVLSAGALAVGLLFYEKPAFMLVFLALVRVLFMSERLSPRRVAQDFWREQRLWLSYCAVLAVWALGYLNSGAYASGGHVTAAQYLNYFRLLWVNTLVPALAGFTVPAARLSSLQVAAVAALQIVVVALLLVSVRRRPAAWRAWAFIAAAVALEGAVVAHARVAQFGVAIGNDLRYLTDFTWLIPFALCWGLAGARVRPALPLGTSDRPRIRVRVPRTPAAIAAIAAILAGAYVAAATATSIHLQSSWNSVWARRWESNVQQGFAQLAHRGAHPVVADQAVPFQIISYPFAPDNRLSRVLPLYAAGVQVDGPLRGPLFVVDAQGDPGRAAFAQTVSAGTATGLVQTHRLSVANGSVTTRHGGACVRAGNRPAQIERRLDPVARAPGPYYLRLSSLTTRVLSLAVFQDTGAGYPGSTPDWITVSPSASQSIAWLSAGLPRRFKLGLPPHTMLCLRRLDVVTLQSQAK